MFLEKQIGKVDGIVSGFEKQLAKDGAILDETNALQSRSKKLQVLCFRNQKKQLRLQNTRYLKEARLYLSNRSDFSIMLSTRARKRTPSQRKMS